MPRTTSFKLLEPYATIDGVDLSDCIMSAKVNIVMEEESDTSSGDGAQHTTPTLRNDSFELKLRQNFDAAKLNGVIWPHVRDGSDIEVLVAGNGSVISATNPSWSALCTAREYAPLEGDIGALVAPTLTFKAQEPIVKSNT